MSLRALRPDWHMVLRGNLLRGADITLPISETDSKLVLLGRKDSLTVRFHNALADGVKIGALVEGWRILQQVFASATAVVTSSVKNIRPNKTVSPNMSECNLSVQGALSELVGKTVAPDTALFFEIDASFSALVTVLRQLGSLKNKTFGDVASWNLWTAYYMPYTTA